MKRHRITRLELQTELEKLEIYIDVQQILSNNTLCRCITDKTQAYISQYKAELRTLLTRKNTLISLSRKSDDFLMNINYLPLKIY